MYGYLNINKTKHPILQKIKGKIKKNQKIGTQYLVHEQHSLKQ